MKKWLLVPMVLLGFTKISHATHLFSLNATNINTGTLDPSRVSPTTFTLQGNTFNGAGQLVQLGSDGRLPGNILAQPSTTTVAYNLLVSTAGGSGTIISSATASFINIMGCEAVNFSSSAALAKSGAGGLDVGVAASSQSYTLLAIANSACTQFGVMFTSQPLTQPIMPSGFTKWRPLASYYNNSGGGLIAQSKRGRRVTRIGNQFICDIANLSTTPSQFDMTQWVSSNAVSATFHAYATGANSGGTAAFVLKSINQVGSSPTPDNLNIYAFPDLIAGFGFGADITVPILDSKTAVFYEVSNVGEFILFMTGYEEEY